VDKSLFLQPRYDGQFTTEFNLWQKNFMWNSLARRNMLINATASQKFENISAIAKRLVQQTSMAGAGASMIFISLQR
jgi:hypothetical protein